METQQSSKIICTWCSMPVAIIWVHGHGQCSNCGINIDECCRGENCSNVEENYFPSRDNTINEK